jgi:hypothetical protein
MAAPPSDEGADQATETSVSPEVPNTAVGAPGTVEGVTAADAVEYTDLPFVLWAETLNV